MPFQFFTHNNNMFFVYFLLAYDLTQCNLSEFEFSFFGGSWPEAGWTPWRNWKKPHSPVAAGAYIFFDCLKDFFNQVSLAGTHLMISSHQILGVCNAHRNSTHSVWPPWLRCCHSSWPGRLCLSIQMTVFLSFSGWIAHSVRWCLSFKQVLNEKAIWHIWLSNRI